MYERSPHPAHRLGTQPDSGCRVVVSAAALAPYPKVKPAYWVDLRGRLSNPAIREVVAQLPAQSPVRSTRVSITQPSRLVGVVGGLLIGSAKRSPLTF